jgi:hypothetical protein
MVWAIQTEHRYRHGAIDDMSHATLVDIRRPSRALAAASAL